MMDWRWAVLVVVWLLTMTAGFWLTGCATYRADFVDCDGTAYSVRATSALFSLQDEASQWSYRWDADGGSIAVGADRAVDSTGQIEALQAAIDAMALALRAYQTGGLLP